MKAPKKTDLWDLMSPSVDQLLAEALAKTDEDVAESLMAKGYDLAALDAELVGLIARLPTRASKKGFVTVSVASTLAAIGCVCAYLARAAAPVAVVISTAAAAPPVDAGLQDSPPTLETETQTETEKQSWQKQKHYPTSR